MSDFEKRINNFQLGLTDSALGAWVAKGLEDMFILSQQDVPILTGFLASTGKAEMTGPHAGRVTYDANYAVAQHDGFTSRGGKFVKGKKYLYPKNANTAFKIMVNDMRKFYNDLARGIISPSAVPKVNLPLQGKGAGKIRPRRATVMRITATGKKSYLYRGPKGRFTKVFFPGLGKAQGQAGRRKRIGSGQ